MELELVCQVSASCVVVSAEFCQTLLQLNSLVFILRVFFVVLSGQPIRNIKIFI